jgi:two-component system CheB/CheR fusion protein
MDESARKHVLQNIAGADDSAAGLRILVVEDYLDSARSMAIMLGMFGHEVEIALDGRNALASARRTEPDVVVLDLGLPDMDGWEVAEALGKHATQKKPFIIVVSAHGGPEHVRRSREVGVDLHLVKPIDPQYLEGVLKRFQQVIL